MIDCISRLVYACPVLDLARPLGTHARTVVLSLSVPVISFVVEASDELMSPQLQPDTVAIEGFVGMIRSTSAYFFHSRPDGHR